MKVPPFAIISLLMLGACTYEPGSENKGDWYAVLENGGPRKLSPVSKERGFVCLEISTTSWAPLFGPDGLGGPREGYIFWTNLAGAGPVYKNPALMESDRLVESQYSGTITILRANRIVKIDLQRIVSRPGEPLRTEPSPANGTYPIRRWIE